MTLRKMTTAGERLTTPMSLAAPVQQHTPDQAFFRNTGVNNWGAQEQPYGACAPVSHLRCYEDGTVDVINLDANIHSWIDLGGSGARDFKAGRF